jgi:hypothetical protein
MNTHSKIDSLWIEFRMAINRTYKAAISGTPEACLRDYAEDISWHDDLAKLLGRETANERDHRRNSPAPKGFSMGDASKLILMNMAALGSRLDVAPSATIFLEARQTAAEAEVIGWLCRRDLSDKWRAELETMDYAKLMRA